VNGLSLGIAYVLRLEQKSVARNANDVGCASTLLNNGTEMNDKCDIKRFKNFSLLFFLVDKLQEGFPSSVSIVSLRLYRE
jgi:hypothetical protein